VSLGLETIPVPPDRVTLRQIAQLSGGRYFDTADADELSGIYEQLGSRLGSETERREVTAAFAPAAWCSCLRGVPCPCAGTGGCHDVAPVLHELARRLRGETPLGGGVGGPEGPACSPGLRTS
jgi:hypothetical protein